MNRKQFIDALQSHLHRGEFRQRGHRQLTAYLRWYFMTQVKGDFEFTRILVHLPELLNRAFTLLRESDLPEVRSRRKSYLEAVEKDQVPVLTDVTEGLDRILAILSLGSLMKDVTGESFVERRIEAYFMAQDMLLMHGFNEFAYRVYLNGLSDIIDKSRRKGMSGTFSSTTLRSYVIAGRIMFSFSQKNGEGNEKSVSFVGEEDEKDGVRFGMQALYCTLEEALHMMSEVVSGWSSTPQERQLAYVDNDNVSII